MNERALIYLRVSSQMQAEGFSLPAQIDACRTSPPPTAGPRAW